MHWLGRKTPSFVPDNRYRQRYLRRARVLDWEELSNVVLVGHSLAGTTISGVADQRPFRLRQLIFLDSLLLQNGECLLDHTPEDIITQRRQSAARSSDNTVPPFPATAFGLTDLDHINRVNRLATPQAFGSFTERMALNNPIGNGIPCTYVRCTQPPHLSAAASSRWAQQQPDWQFVEMEACHDVMIEKPVELAELLVRLAGPG